MVSSQRAGGVVSVDEVHPDVVRSVGVDAVVLEAGTALVVSVSESLQAWSGYDEHELVGRPVWETLARGDLGDLLRDAHQDPSGSSVSGVVEGAVTAKDDSTRLTRWAQVPVAGVEAARVVMTDLGPTPPAPVESGVVTDEPSVLDRVTRGLLETLSHELRTPVASVAGYAELLREGEGGQLSMMQRKFVGAIARNSERLRGLADQLLLIGGLESRATQLQLVPFDLREAVSSVRISLAASGLERVERRARAGGRALPGGRRPRPAGPGRRGAGGQRRQVHPRQRPRSRAPRGREGRHALIEVVDDGVGFAAEDEPELAVPPVLPLAGRPGPRRPRSRARPELRGGRGQWARGRDHRRRRRERWQRLHDPAPAGRAGRPGLRQRGHRHRRHRVSQ